MTSHRKSRGSWAVKVAVIAAVVVVGFRVVESKGLLPSGITGSSTKAKGPLG